jgi:hypothetical protein
VCSECLIRQSVPTRCVLQVDLTEMYSSDSKWIQKQLMITMNCATMSTQSEITSNKQHVFLIMQINNAWLIHERGHVNWGMQFIPSAR